MYVKPCDLVPFQTVFGNFKSALGQYGGVLVSCPDPFRKNLDFSERGLGTRLGGVQLACGEGFYSQHECK